jgi:ketosteroid isomerase-like protein
VSREERELEGFIARWLEAWTGNDPEGLMEFYADDAFYSDPGTRTGLNGRDELTPYFTKLLAANPEWRWRLLEVAPTARGAFVKWHASIPVGAETIEEDGADIVEIEGGRITRNEVFFDRAALMAAIAAR